MKTLKAKWAKASRRRSGPGFGIFSDVAEEPLTNLRFADDILMFARTKADIGKMIRHLQEESAKYGLKMHLGKTKILSLSAHAAASMRIGPDLIQILGITESEKYLGRKLCLGTMNATELANRIAAGWAGFMQFKSELCSKTFPTHAHVKLFDAVVTSKVLYAAATLTLTSAMEEELRTARRRMLRLMFVKRRVQQQEPSADLSDGMGVRYWNHGSITCDAPLI